MFISARRATLGKGSAGLKQSLPEGAHLPDCIPQTTKLWAQPDMSLLMGISRKQTFEPVLNVMSAVANKAAIQSLERAAYWLPTVNTPTTGLVLHAQMPFARRVQIEW